MFWTAEVFWKVESLRAHATDVEGSKAVLVRERERERERERVAIGVLDTCWRSWTFRDVLCSLFCPLIGEVHLRVGSTLGT